MPINRAVLYSLITIGDSRASAVTPEFQSTDRSGAKGIKKSLSPPLKTGKALRIEVCSSETVAQLRAELHNKAHDDGTVILDLLGHFNRLIASRLICLEYICFRLHMPVTV